jgi:cobalt/nickel transport protein
MRRLRFILGGLAVCLLLAGVVSNFASGSPDGLEHAAGRGCTLDEHGEIIDGTCIARAAEEHALSDNLFADYGLRGPDDVLGAAVSGVVGVLLTFTAGGALFWLLRRRARQPGRGP